MGRRAEDTEAERDSYEAAMKVYEQKSAELENLKESISDKEKLRFNCTCFIERLNTLDETDISFSEKLWCSLVDHVSAPDDGEKALVFHLRSGEVMIIQLN